jgi:hypothetical protein
MAPTSSIAHHGPGPSHPPPYLAHVTVRVHECREELQACASCVVCVCRENAREMQGREMGGGALVRREGMQKGPKGKNGVDTKTHPRSTLVSLARALAERLHTCDATHTRTEEDREPPDDVVVWPPGARIVEQEGPAARALEEQVRGEQKRLFQRPQ